MDPSNTPRLVYLVVALLTIGGYFLWTQRRNLGQTARYAATWAAIFMGAFVVVELWNDTFSLYPRQQSLMENGTIEVPRAPDGHFYLTLEVNGVPTDFVVDTGASAIVLSRADAERAGIALDRLIFSGRASTANGTVNTAPTRIATLSLSGIMDENLRAIVNEGEIEGSLLGMSYLNRFSRLEIANGRLILER